MRRKIIYSSAIPDLYFGNKSKWDKQKLEVFKKSGEMFEDTGQNLMG